VALTGLKGEVSASYLATALNDRDVRVRRDAAEALGEVGGPAARRALKQALQDSDPVVREIAAEMLAEPAGDR
jgi:HEAT repeat protein